MTMRMTKRISIMGARRTRCLHRCPAQTRSRRKPTRRIGDQAGVRSVTIAWSTLEGVKETFLIRRSVWREGEDGPAVSATSKGGRPYSAPCKPKVMAIRFARHYRFGSGREFVREIRKRHASDR